MRFTFSTQDAQLVYAFIASVLVPFIVARIARCKWPAWEKLTLAIIVSVLAGALSQYAAGALNGGSAVVAALGVFTASQAHFATWFQALKLDDTLEQMGGQASG